MARIISTLFATILILCIALPSEPAHAQSKAVKIGYVDIERVNKEYTKIQSAVDLLNDTYVQRQEELDAMYEGVKKAKEEYDNLVEEDRRLKGQGAEGVPESKLSAAQKTAAEKDRDYRREYQVRSNRFDTTKEELLYPRLIEVAAAVKKVGESGGYSVILKKEVTRFAASRNDVTSQVLSILETKAKSKPTTAALYESGIRSATEAGSNR